MKIFVNDYNSIFRRISFVRGSNLTPYKQRFNRPATRVALMKRNVPNNKSARWKDGSKNIPFFLWKHAWMREMKEKPAAKPYGQCVQAASTEVWRNFSSISWGERQQWILSD